MQIVFNESFDRAKEEGIAKLKQEVPLLARSLPLLVDFIATPEYFFLIREVTGDMIRRKVDIDSYTNDDFKVMVIMTVMTRVQQMEFMKAYKRQKITDLGLSKQAPMNRKMRRKLQKRK